VGLKQCLAIGLIAGLAGCTSVATPSAPAAAPSYAIPSAVTPSSGSESSSPSLTMSTESSGADRPSIAPRETFAVTFAGRRSVPAGETVIQALAFESTSVATVTLDAPSGTLSARVGSTPLVEKDVVRGFSNWGLTLNAPADANLTITNTSTTAVDVDALVWLATTRTLTVSTPATAVAGEAIVVDVSLTEAANGEKPSAFLVDGSDAKTPIPLAQSGPLRDSGGLYIAQGTGRTTLNAAGLGSILMDFDGEEILRSGTSGRYRLTDVVLFQPDKGLLIEDQKADMGLTAASYDADAFEPLP
jgi:hypothetical protein